MTDGQTITATVVARMAIQDFDTTTHYGNLWNLFGTLFRRCTSATTLRQMNAAHSACHGCAKQCRYLCNPSQGWCEGCSAFSDLIRFKLVVPITVRQRLRASPHRRWG